MNEPGTERRARRRPGRARRWIARPLLWGVAAAALVVAGLAAYLGSEAFEGGVRRRLVAELTARLGRPVEVAELDLRLLPLALEARGVTVAGRSAEEGPLLTVRRVLVEAGLEPGSPPTLAIQRVRIEEPVLALLFDADGGDNLVRWGGGGGGGAAPLAVRIERAEVAGGLLALGDLRVPLDLEARALRAALGASGAGDFRGDLELADLRLVVAGGLVAADRLAVAGRLDRDGLEMTRGLLQSADLTTTFHGSLRWRGERELTVDFDAAGEVGVARRWGFVEAPLAGAFRFRGAFDWRPELWGLRGTVSSPRLDLLDRSFEELTAVASVDRGGVRVDVESARHAGGRLGGALRVGLAAEERPVEIDLTLAGTRLGRLAADLGLPLPGVEGIVGGAVGYRFAAANPRGGSGWADLQVSGDLPVREGRLALGGAVPLTIDRGVVRTSAVRLASGSQQLTAAGFLDLQTSSGSFDYAIESADLAELLPLLPFVEDPAAPPLWLPAAGRGTIDGTLRLGAEPSGPVRLELAEVAAPGYRAERLHGSFELTGAGVERLRIELQRPEGAVIVTADVPFAGAGPPFALAADLAGWPAAELAPWLPLELGVNGPVNGRLELDGETSAIHGRAVAAIAPATWGALEADRLELDVEFDPVAVVFHRATVHTPAGSLGAAGRGDLVSGLWEADFAAPELDLARPPFAARGGEVAGGAPLAGRAALAGRFRGTLEAPRLEIELTAEGLAMGGGELGQGGEAEARLSLEEGRLSAAGSLLGLLRFGGGGELAADRVELELTVESDRLAEIASLAGVPAEGLSGSLAGTLRVAGDPRAAGDLEVELALDRLVARRGELTLENLEPVLLRPESGGLRIDSLYVGQPGTASELFVSGRVPFVAEEPIDLRLQSSLEASWLELALPGVDLRGGTFEAIGTVGGTAAAPRVDGVGEIQGTRAVVPGLPRTLEGLRAVLLFYPGEIVLDRADARVAGGTLRASGNVRPREGGWADPDYRLQFSADGLSLRYPEGWRLRGGAECTLTSIPGGRQLRGRVRLERAIYVQDLKTGASALAESFFGRQRLEIEETDEWLAATFLNLEVTAADALEVHNNVADLHGTADLSVRGSLARPVVFGSVTIEPGGTLSYSGNRYTVERGLLTFANPYRVEPIVDLVANTRLRDYDIVLNVTGPLDKFDVSLASDPPLADLDVLTLLAAGDAPRAGAGGERDSINAEALLVGQAASVVGDRANRLFGFDTFRVAPPLTGSATDFSAARVTVGKRLSRDLFATYSYDPSSTAEQILEVRWQVSPTLVIILTQNGDESYALDGRWEKSY